MMQTYGSTEGYNSRRKRQLDLSGVRNKKVEGVTGIHWGNEKKLTPESEEIGSGWEEIEVSMEPSNLTEHPTQKPVDIHRPPADTTGITSLNGKPIRFQNVEKVKHFEETHVRFTNFLERDLFAVIKSLKKQGHIRSITELLNESVKHYLTCNKT